MKHFNTNPKLGNEYFRDACAAGDLKLVKTGLAFALVNGRNENGVTALHRASNNGHLEVVKLLVDNRAEINQIDNNGNTALHRAALEGRTDIVEYLVNKGAEINQVTNNGNAALHLVSSNGHIDIVKLLVENDAALYQFNNDKLIPWVLALVKGHENIVDYLNELLEHEPEHGELAKCSELVRNNLGINFDDNGATSSGNTENDLYNQD